MNNNKGFSLITTLIFSFVALGFMAALLYLTMGGITTSGSAKRYTSANEVSKAVTDNIIYFLHSNQLCGAGNNCPDNATNLNINGINSPDSNYSVSVTLLKKEAFSKNSKNYSLYFFNLVTTANNSNEKSDIYFAYELEKN
jgi:hypothetical protein